MTNSTRCILLAKQACTTLSHVVQKITPPSANNFLKLFFALFAMLALGVGNAWGETYKLTKVTSVSAGEKYVFEQKGYVMTNKVTSSKLQCTNDYKKTGLSGTEAYVWMLEAADGGFYMKNVSLSTNQYLNNASSTNVSLGSKSSIWTFAFTNEIAVVQNTKNSDRFLGYTSTTAYEYKAYATSNLSNTTYPHDITVYKLEVEAAQSHTITAVSNNDSWGTVSLNGATITAEPKAGYCVSASIPYEVTSGTATVTQNENTFTVNASSDCTVKINFEALPTYTVKFDAGAGSCTTSTLTETLGGTGITLPSATIECGDWVFAGWWGSQVAETTTSPGTLLKAGDNYKPANDNVTLYAVYTKTEGGGSPTSVTSEDLFEDGGKFTSASGSAKAFITWTKADVISIKQEQGTSTSPVVADYVKDPRWYKSHCITITPSANITSITTTAQNETYATALAESTYTNATASASGATVTIIPTDGTKQIIITMGAQARLYTLTVTYTSAGGTTTYNSNPDCNLPATLIGIAANAEGKDEFTVGDEFVKAIITATYDDATTKDVTEEATFTGYDMSTPSEQTVTVEYEDKTTTYTITVTAKPAATLTLSKNGDTSDKIEGKVGDVITLPYFMSDCSKTFVGWDANPTCNVAPEYAAGDSYTLAATAQTLYAVYATAGAGETLTITPSAVSGSADPYTFTIDAAGYSLTAKKNGGSTAPTYNDGKADARVYAQGTVTLTAPKALSQVVFNLSTQGLTRLAPITVSVGDIATQAIGDATVTWTGDATEVTFTVGDKADFGSDGSSKGGQLCFSTITVTTVGSYSNYSTTCAAAPTAEVDPTSVTATAAETTGKLTVTYDNVKREDVKVALYNDAACTEEFTAGWLTVSLDGDKNVTYTVSANTLYTERKAYIKLTAPETTGATDPAKVVIPVTQAGKDKVFASLEELVAADLTAGDEVTVTLKNDVIKDFYIYNSNRAGVVFDVQKDGKDIKIYFNNQTTIVDWAVGGKLSGTLSNVKWSTYSNAWQLAPDYNTWAWANLTYTEPKAVSTVVVSGAPTKTTYVDGEAFDPAGLTVTVNYNDATSEENPTGVTFNVTPATLTKGQTSVNVTATYNSISSAAYEVTGLTVNDIPTKTIAEFIAARGTRCYLEGIVSGLTEGNSMKYGNFDLTDVSGTIYVYGCLNASGEKEKFAELGVKNGDKIKVIADELTVYNSKDQAKDVQYVSHISAATITIADITMEVGETKTIAATVVPAEAEVTYTIKENAANAISLSGNTITALAEGTATISANIAETNEYLAATIEFTVTVTSAEQGGEDDNIKTATLTFDDKSKRTTFTTSQQVWQENGITLTNDKFKSTSNVADYYKPARFYKTSHITIEHTSKKITKIVFDCYEIAYASALNEAIMGAGEISNDKVTYTLPEAKESFEIVLSAGQVKLDAITVEYYSDGSETPTPTPDPIPGYNPVANPTTLSGVFSVAADKKVQFSTGNLQYEVGTNTWSFASEQYEVIGGEAYTESNNTNYGMNVPNYTGKLDLFAWSCDGKYGVNPSNTDSDYQGTFVDWGTLAGEGWFTLTKEEMNYILNRTKNGKKLWALATIDKLPGLILLPDNWNTNITLTYGYIPTQFVYKENLFTADEWEILEVAGAVFLPAAGSRTGGYGNKDNAGFKESYDANGDYFHVDNVGIYGYYWLNTQDPRPNFKHCASYLILPGWDEGPTVDEEGVDDLSTHPQVWSREKRRGNSVRLVKTVEEEPTTTVSGRWELVTDASTLAVGDQVVIAAAKSNVALSTAQKDNNRGQAAVTKNNDDNTISFSADVQVLTLEASTVDNTFALNTGKGYLYAASSSSNHLKTQKDKDKNASWEITITDGTASIVAQGTNTRNVMQYNQPSSLFACYASASQQAICLYRKKNVKVDNNQNTDDIQNFSDITVGNNSELEVTKPLIVENLYIQTTMGAATSAQISNATNTNLLINGDVFIDITLGKNGDPNQWHAFTVPFPVDAMNGVYDINDKKLTNEVNYAIMDYHGDLRANGQYGWKKYRGILVPGTFYLMTVDGERTTYRFKKVKGAELIAPATKELKAYDTGTGESTDFGWNGVGNPTLMHGKVAYDAQILDPEWYIYKTITATSSDHFTVGTPFFIQAAVAGTMTITAEPSASASLAPARRAAAAVENIKVMLGNSDYTDRLYVSASEDATNEYEIGKDLGKMAMTSTPSVVQISALAYDTRLCMIDAPMANNEALVALNLYAPANGEYTLSVEAQDNEKVYLLHEGTFVWDLSMSEYPITLNKGDNTGYSILVHRADAPTSVETIDGANNQTEKLIHNGNLYILHNGKVFDAVGTMLK